MAVTTIPDYTPVYQNSGGGMLGAIRAKINARPDYVSIFGDRIFPGRAPPKTSFPYVVTSHVSCLFDDYMGYAYSSESLPLDTWKEMVQVSVFSDSYEASRQLAKLIHAILSRHTLIADAIPCFMYPETRQIVLDPQKSERAGDVWHVDHRYSYWFYEWVFPDDWEPCPGDVPFNTLDPDLDVGPPWDF
jgi:hypothetical protein